MSEPGLSICTCQIQVAVMVGQLMSLNVLLSSATLLRDGYFQMTTLL